MSKSNPTSGPSILVGGDNRGQIAQGEGNIQTQSVGVPNPAIADAKTLSELLSALKAQVAADAPADQKDDALGKIKELEWAATAEKPKLGTMEAVKEWFEAHLPTLSATVSKAIVTPVMSEVMKGAGEEVFKEFQRRFGLS